MSNCIEFYRTAKSAPFRYSDLLKIQQARMAEGLRGVLLGEVEPVITLGRGVREEKKSLELIESSEWYASRGIEILEVDRGGLATWHGPGQWVIFPVMPRVRPDVKRITCALLEVLKATALELGVDARIASGAELGVWNGSKKIGALGVHFSREGMTHGVSLNIFESELSFKGLRPCGLDLPVGYLMEPIEGVKRFEEVGKVLADRIAEFVIDA